MQLELIHVQKGCTFKLKLILHIHLEKQQTKTTSPKISDAEKVPAEKEKRNNKNVIFRVEENIFISI